MVIGFLGSIKQFFKAKILKYIENIYLRWYNVSIDRLINMSYQRKSYFQKRASSSLLLVMLSYTTILTITKDRQVLPPEVKPTD